MFIDEYWKKLCFRTNDEKYRKKRIRLETKKEKKERVKEKKKENTSLKERISKVKRLEVS